MVMAEDIVCSGEIFQGDWRCYCGLAFAPSLFSHDRSR